MSTLPSLPSGVSVVIPVFNAAGNLPELYRQLMPAMEGLASRFEVILVEDSSSDGSWAAVSELAARDARVRGIRLSRNFGQHNALLCGIRIARFDRVCTLDDDLQNPPEELPKLIATMTDDIDVVYGVPEHERHGFWRNIASVVTKIVLQKAMGATIARNISAYRLVRTRLRAAASDFRGPYVSIDVLLTWATNRFAMVRVKHDARSIGISNYTLRKLMSHALNMLTGFSTPSLHANRRA